MARTKSNQRPEPPVLGQAEARMPASPASLLILAASAVTAVWSAAMLTASGRVVYGYLFFFMEFFAGVFCLLALTATVVGGLLATDRMLLQVRHRVLLQSIHRFTAVLAVIFLVVHIMTKTSMGRAAPIDAFLPFAAAGGVYVGLGTIASYFLVSVFFTGVLRAKFVGVGRPWMWRTLHSGAYLAWPIGITHGLTAGRPAATWVTASYLAVVVLVTVGLLARLAVGSGRRLRAQTTDTMKPIGRLSPAMTPISARPAAPPRRSAADAAAAPAAPRRSTTAVPGDSASRRSATAAQGDAVSRSRRSWPDSRVGSDFRAGSDSRAGSDFRAGSDSRAGSDFRAPVSAPTGGSRRAARDYPTEPDYAVDDPRDYAARDYGANDSSRDYATEAPAPRMTFFRPSTRPRRQQSSFSAPVPDEARQQSDFGMAMPERPRRRSADEYLTGDPAQYRPGGDYGGGEARSGRSARHSAPPDFEPEIIELGVLEHDAGRRDSRRRRAERRDSERNDTDRRRDADRRDAERRREAERWVRENLEAERRERAEADRRERAEAERRERADADRRERERLEEERRERERQEAERRERDRLEAERRERERAESDLRYVGVAPGYRYGLGDNYLPPDDTPTLIDMAARRERRATRDSAAKSSRSARRRREAEDADVQYWRELRGQAQ